MLLIKREQREAMGEPAFVDRTVDRFRRYYLEFVYMLDEEELRLRVKHGIERARSYGLTYESSITTFVANMITINPEWDKHPAVQKALHDTELPVNSRIPAMMGCISDEEWEEAAAQGDPDAYWARFHEELAKEGGS